jgi:phosphate transport system permease protein
MRSSETIVAAPARRNGAHPQGTVVQLPGRRDQLSRFWRHGLPAIWCSGLMVVLLLAMLGGMVTLILTRGLGQFWPAGLVQIRTQDAEYLGPVRQRETVRLPATGDAAARRVHRLQLHVGNRDLYGQDFRWIDETAVVERSFPADAVVLERQEHGNFHGYLRGVEIDGAAVADGSAGDEPLWQRFKDEARESRRMFGRLQELEHDYDAARQEERDGLIETLAQRVGVFATVDGREKRVQLDQIVRAYRPNQMNVATRSGFYVTKLWEFVSTQPRESNTEGGIYPALFGTVLMVLLMTIAVVPFGVIAALYLHEYARAGAIVRAVRLAVANLAGVPSIVFGMFGLAFFVYGVGGAIDRTFYADALPNPTFGTGGILWASLTLALLTLPVVVVATEEGLSAVPRANREGSLALGATKWQTLWHVVLPQAVPGILTGVILAISRAAGEVAPLMLTGVVKLAPALALDTEAPFVHLERKFMHLGFHVYDVSMQSPNVEAAKPMVYSTTLLLLVLVVALNASAIVVRNNMRRRYRGAAV